MKKTLIFIISCVIGLYTFAQNEASNWYFGENAGIKFNVFTGGVTPLNDGQINTREGCASISDSTGQLLFYTDGTTVYNRFHTVMQNGNNLLGDRSSTQSAIVVPKPNNPNIYYIFTVGSNQTNTGLNYSIVDVTAQDGIVTSKNINLLSQCAEKISAVVKDCDTKSIWVITLANSSGNSDTNFNTFFAYEIDALGVNPNPVTSNLPFNIEDPRGYLKLSPDGSKLACANVQSGLYLADFDSDTGVVSNSQPLNIDDRNNKSYGLEFSSNSEFLYVTATNDYFNLNNPNTNNDPTNHTSILAQFDLTAPNISGSMFVLDNRQMYRGGLQLGPNGKIYRALSSTYNSGINGLGVINKPNELGISASYDHNAVTLPNNSTQGLPPFITSFFNQQIDIIRNGQENNFLPLCDGESYILEADEILGATYTWTRDGVLLPESDFDLIVSENGIYKVIVEPPGSAIANNCGFPQGEAIVQFFEYPVTNNSSLLQCDLDLSSVGLTTFNLAEANEIITNNLTDITITYHRTQNDADNGTDAITNSDSYNNSVPNELLYARVTHDLSGCFETASLRLGVSNTQVDLFSATPVCDEQESPDGINLFLLTHHSAEIIQNLGLSSTDVRVKFYATNNDALLEKNEILEYTNTIPYSQNIYYRVETNNNECYGINQIELKVDKLPRLELDETNYYCLNTFPSPITVEAGIINGLSSDYTYQWSTGATTHEIIINSIGTYSVEVTNSLGCSRNRTVTIEASNIATFSQNPTVIDVSSNNSIAVFVTGEGTYQYSLVNSNNDEIAPFQDFNIFENVYPGIYKILVRDIKNDCGTIIDEVSVVGFPKFFTPNNDGVNDTWQILGISDMFQANSKVFIYDRYGKLIKQLNPTGNGWNGTLNGNVLPADDYWFAVKLQDGRIFKSHFTLKL